MAENQDAARVYHKLCGLRTCRAPFETTRRGERYHDEACRDRARKKAQVNRKQRVQYKRHAPRLRAATFARHEARAEAFSRLPVRCQHCGSIFSAKEEDLHHVNGDPRWNPPDGSNWAWLCHVCHPKADAGWRAARKVMHALGIGACWILDPRIFPWNVLEISILDPRTLNGPDLRWDHEWNGDDDA